MIRQQVIESLRDLASALGTKANGSEWHLFGSVARDDCDASDIDLMIFCTDNLQADRLRCAIDPDSFSLPLHLALMTYAEAIEVNAIKVQQSEVIFP